jgi:hypothetical protein
MNMGTFLKKLNFIVTGNGFLREKILNISNFHLDSTGAPLTTTLTTNPGFDKLGTNMVGLAWAAGKVVAAGIDIPIPMDYDESKDVFKVKLKFKMAGSTDTPTVTVAAYKDDDSTTDLAPTAISALSSTATWKEIDLDGNDLQGGDTVHISLTPGTHGTDAVELYGVKIEYASDIVAFNKSDR